MSKNYTKISIRGKVWKVRIFTNAQFSERHDDDAAAITVFPREIHFRIGYLDLTTIIHELSHAYFEESHTSSADLKPYQVEELMCEVFGEFGAEIIKTAKKLKKFLKNKEGDL
jgi:hypothetical protein